MKKQLVLRLIIIGLLSLFTLYIHYQKNTYVFDVKDPSEDIVTYPFLMSKPIKLDDNSYLIHSNSFGAFILKLNNNVAEIDKIRNSYTGHDILF